MQFLQPHRLTTGGQQNPATPGSISPAGQDLYSQGGASFNAGASLGGGGMYGSPAGGGAGKTMGWESESGVGGGGMYGSPTGGAAGGGGGAGKTMSFETEGGIQRQQPWGGGMGGGMNPGIGVVDPRAGGKSSAWETEGGIGGGGTTGGGFGSGIGGGTVGGGMNPGVGSPSTGSPYSFEGSGGGASYPQMPNVPTGAKGLAGYQPYSDDYIGSQWGEFQKGTVAGRDESQYPSGWQWQDPYFDAGTGSWQQLGADLTPPPKKGMINPQHWQGSSQTQLPSYFGGQQQQAGPMQGGTPSTGSDMGAYGQGAQRAGGTSPYGATGGAVQSPVTQPSPFTPPSTPQAATGAGGSAGGQLQQAGGQSPVGPQPVTIPDMHNPSGPQKMMGYSNPQGMQQGYDPSYGRGPMEGAMSRPITDTGPTTQWGGLPQGGPGNPLLRTGDPNEAFNDWYGAGRPPLTGQPGAQPQATQPGVTASGGPPEAQRQLGAVSVGGGPREAQRQLGGSGAATAGLAEGGGVQPQPRPQPAGTGGQVPQPRQPYNYNPAGFENMTGDTSAFTPDQLERLRQDRGKWESGYVGASFQGAIPQAGGNMGPQTPAQVASTGGGAASMGLAEGYQPQGREPGMAGQISGGIQQAPGAGGVPTPRPINPGESALDWQAATGQQGMIGIGGKTYNTDDYWKRTGELYGKYGDGNIPYSREQMNAALTKMQSGDLSSMSDTEYRAISDFVGANIRDFSGDSPIRDALDREGYRRGHYATTQGGGGATMSFEGAGGVPQTQGNMGATTPAQQAATGGQTATQGFENAGTPRGDPGISVTPAPMSGHNPGSTNVQQLLQYMIERSMRGDTQDEVGDQLAKMIGGAIQEQQQAYNTRGGLVDQLAQNAQAQLGAYNDSTAQRDDLIRRLYGQRSDNTFGWQGQSAANLSNEYANRQDAAMGLVGQMGQSQLQNVADQFTQRREQIPQSLINRGLFNTTIQDSLQTGVAREEGKAMNDAMDRILQNQLSTYMGTSGDRLSANERLHGERVALERQMPKDLIDYLERIDPVPPDMASMMNLAMMAGQGGPLGGLGNMAGAPLYQQNPFQMPQMPQYPQIPQLPQQPSQPMPPATGGTDPWSTGGPGNSDTYINVGGGTGTGGGTTGGNTTGGGTVGGGTTGGGNVGGGTVGGGGATGGGGPVMPGSGSGGMAGSPLLPYGGQYPYQGPGGQTQPSWGSPPMWPHTGLTPGEGMYDVGAAMVGTHGIPTPTGAMAGTGGSYQQPGKVPVGGDLMSQSAGAIPGDPPWWMYPPGSTDPMYPGDTPGPGTGIAAPHVGGDPSPTAQAIAGAIGDGTPHQKPIPDDILQGLPMFEGAQTNAAGAPTEQRAAEFKTAMDRYVSDPYRYPQPNPSHYGLPNTVLQQWNK